MTSNTVEAMVKGFMDDAFCQLGRPELVRDETYKGRNELAGVNINRAMKAALAVVIEELEGEAKQQELYADEYQNADSKRSLYLHSAIVVDEIADKLKQGLTPTDKEQPHD